jgi:hypothetical protein
MILMIVGSVLSVIIDLYEYFQSRLPLNGIDRLRWWGSLMCVFSDHRGYYRVTIGKSIFDLLSLSCRLIVVYLHLPLPAVALAARFPRLSSSLVSQGFYSSTTTPHLSSMDG